MIEENIKNFLFPIDYEYLFKETILLIQWVKKINKKDSKNQRLLIITEFEFLLFRKKIFSNILIFSRKFEWFSLKKINFLNPKKLFLFFNNSNLELDELNVEIIFKMIYEYCNSYCLKEELPEFLYSENLNFPNIKKSIISRMKMKLYLENKKLPKNVILNINNFLETKPNSFKLNQIKSLINYLQIFLESLIFEPNIIKLIIPCNFISNSISLLTSFIKKNNTIQELYFEEQLSDDFHIFIQSLLSNPESQINLLSFKNCNFSLNQIQDLLTFIKNFSFETLILNSSLSYLIINPFILKIDSNPGFLNLTTLVLDKTPGINIKILIESIKTIEILSIVECECDISELFLSLSKNLEIKLTYLNASKNLCNSIISNDIKLPLYLYKFNLTDISWDYETFLFVLRSILYHKPISLDLTSNCNGIDLQISKIRLPKGKWNDFFIEINNLISKNLNKLIWDENLIHENFFNFLNKCKNLIGLSLSGCFNLNDPLFNNFLNFLKNNNILEILSLQGKKNKIISLNDLINLISILKDNLTISRIDLSKNEIGPEILNHLLNLLLQNKNILILLFIKNNINNIENYISFFENLKKRRYPLKILWPTEEIQEMLEFRIINLQKIKYLKSLYLEIFHGSI